MIRFRASSLLSLLSIGVASKLLVILGVSLVVFLVLASPPSRAAGDKPAIGERSHPESGLTTPAPRTRVGPDEFELVESTPVETDLDNKDIPDAYEVWLDMIGRARNTLDLEQFYVSNAPGEPLEDVLSAIILAAKRGVCVRFIADSRMYRTYPETLDSLGAMENIEVRILDMVRLAGGVMHAKYFIVDGDEFFLGSQNFDWRALKHIHEIGCRVKNKELTRVFLNLFELDWGLAQKGEIKDGRVPDKASNIYVRATAVPAGPTSVAPTKTAAASAPQPAANAPTSATPPPAAAAPTSVTNTPPTSEVAAAGDSIEIWPIYSPTGFIPDERLWDEPGLVSLMDGAKEEVLVQLLNYSSIYDGGYYDVLEIALRRAAARGVAVKLLVSDWSKTSPEIDCLKSLEVLPNIEIKLSTIPEWSGGFIPYARVEHCKYMVIDGERSWIGTSNWERSYFHGARNVGLIVKSTRVGAMLHQVFYKSWNGSYSYSVKPEIAYTAPKRDG